MCFVWLVSLPVLEQRLIKIKLENETNDFIAVGVSFLYGLRLQDGPKLVDKG